MIILSSDRPSLAGGCLIVRHAAIGVAMDERNRSGRSLTTPLFRDMIEIAKSEAEFQSILLNGTINGVDKVV